MVAQNPVLGKLAISTAHSALGIMSSSSPILSVFLLLNLIIRFSTLRPAGRKTRARKYKELCCKCTTMELA